MTITEPSTQLPSQADTIHADPTRWTRTTKRIAIGAATVVAVVAMAAAVQWTRAETEEPAVVTPAVGAPASRMTAQEQLEDLVARGVVPAQSLEVTPMNSRAQLEDLVARGFVPRQALEVGPMTEQEILEDLVNRGLVPRQSLEPAP